MKQILKVGTLLALIVIGMALILLILYKLMALLILVLIALVFTAGIDPMVDWLQHRTARWFRLPRSLAALLVMSAGVLVVLGIFALLTATVVNEVARIAENWPTIQGRLISWLSGVADRFNIDLNTDVLLRQLSAQSGRIISYLFTTTSAIFGFIGGLFTLVSVIILTLFFTIFEAGIARTFLQLVPPQYQQRTREVSHQAMQKMGGWLRGQLLLALIIAIVTMLAMLVFQVPYPALIALIAGLGELVPMLGPYLGAVPAIIIALLLGLGWGKLLLILLFFSVLSQVENYILFPRIMAKNVDLSPVTAILALLAGGALFGIVGALLAIPLTAAARVVMLEVVFPAIQGKSRQEMEHAAGKDGGDGTMNDRSGNVPQPTKAEQSEKSSADTKTASTETNSTESDQTTGE
ncbi:MAG: AI-2E family transporter [Armatimonadota bacterium]